MREAIVYLVTYEGQEESPYTFLAFSASQAITLCEELEEQYPDRVWHIEEKDVS